MKPEDVRRELETSTKLPVDALLHAAAHPDDIAPAVLVALNDAAGGVYLLPRQSQLLFFGLHALAAARRQDVYRPLMRLLHRPEQDIEPLLGDALTETLPRIVVSIFDGDIEPLAKAIENPSVGGIVRWSLFLALARLTFDGKVAREHTAALLDRFDRDRLGGDDDSAWLGWQDAITMLGLADLGGKVRAAYADGRIDESMEEVSEWEERFKQACSNPENPDDHTLARIVPIDDPVTVLDWSSGRTDDADDFGDDDAEPGETRVRDPAAKVALTGDEIDWMSGFLESSKAPLSGMTFEEVDGFFVALAAGPVTVQPSDYLPVIWGTDDGSGPAYDSSEQAEYVLSLLSRHLNTIAVRLGARFPYVPVIDNFGNEFTARAWASSFVRGVAMHPDAWRPLLEDEEHAPPLGIIFALASDHDGEGDRPPTPEELDEVIDHMPLAIAGIHAYWRSGLSGRREPFRRRKIGRNERCPCGSGKKYKNCCGSSRTVH